MQMQRLKCPVYKQKILNWKLALPDDGVTSLETYYEALANEHAR